MKNNTFTTALRLIRSNLKMVILLLLVIAICFSCITVCICLLPSGAFNAKIKYIKDNNLSFQVKAGNNRLLEKYGANHEVNIEGMKKYVAQPDSSYSIYEFESIRQMEEYGFELNYRGIVVFDDTTYLMSWDEALKYWMNDNYATKDGVRYRITYFPDDLIGAEIEGVPQELAGRKCVGIVNEIDEITFVNRLNRDIDSSVQKKLSTIKQMMSNGYFIRSDLMSSSLQATIDVGDVVTAPVSFSCTAEFDSCVAVLGWESRYSNIFLGGYWDEYEMGVYVSWSLYKKLAGLNQSFEEWSGVYLNSYGKFDFSRQKRPRMISEISLKINYGDDTFKTYHLDGVFVEKNENENIIDHSEKIYVSDPLIVMQVFGKDYNRYGDTLSVDAKSVKDLNSLVRELDASEANLLLPYELDEGDCKAKSILRAFEISSIVLGVVAILLFVVLAVRQALETFDKEDSGKKYLVFLLQMLMYATALFVAITVISLIVIFSINAALAGGAPLKFVWVEWYTVPLALAISLASTVCVSASALVALTVKPRKENGKATE